MAGVDRRSAGRRARSLSGYRVVPRVAGQPAPGSPLHRIRLKEAAVKQAIDVLMHSLGYPTDHPGRAIFELGHLLLAARPDADIVGLASGDLYNRHLQTLIARRVDGRRKAFIGGGVLMKEDSDEFRDVTDLAEHLAHLGLQIITGGSMGAMQAAALGSLQAAQANPVRARRAIGVGLWLPTEQKASPSLDPLDFFLMKGLPLRQSNCLDAHVAVLTPGGYGTLSELFDLYLYKIRIGEPGLVFLYSAGDPTFFDRIVELNEFLDDCGFTRPGELFIPFMTSQKETIISIVQSAQLFVDNLIATIEQTCEFDEPSRVARFMFDTSTTPPTDGEFAEFDRLFRERTADLDDEVKRNLKWQLHGKDHVLGAHLELIAPPTQSHLVNLAAVSLIDATLTSGIYHPVRFVDDQTIENDLEYDPDKLHGGGAKLRRSRQTPSPAQAALKAAPIDALKWAMGHAAVLAPWSDVERDVVYAWQNWDDIEEMDPAMAPFAVAHPLRNVESPPTPEILRAGVRAILSATKKWTVAETFDAQRRFSKFLNDRLPDGDFDKVTSPDYRGQNTIELLRILSGARVDATLFGTTALTAQGLLVPSGDADVILPTDKMADACDALEAATGVRPIWDFRDPSVRVNGLVKLVHVSPLGVLELYSRESLEDAYGDAIVRAFDDVTLIDFGDGLEVNSLSVPGALLASQACALQAEALGVSSRQKDLIKQAYALAMAEHGPFDGRLIGNMLGAQRQLYGGNDLADSFTIAGP